ncbi:MAG: hypothetical protein R2753_13130 [Chitinophagales bacterium]
MEDQFINTKWISENYTVQPLYLLRWKHWFGTIAYYMLHHLILRVTLRIAVTSILKEKDAENIYFYM